MVNSELNTYQSEKRLAGEY